MSLNSSSDKTPAVPVLSVTVLNYNYGCYLDQCLSSILAQTMTDFELILINDCSTDNSLEVIEPYLKDPRIRFIDHQTNLGYVASLEEGCHLSRGKYLTVISADDYVLNTEAFHKVNQLFDSEPDVCFCYSAWHEMDNSGYVRHTRRAADHDYILEGHEELRRLLMSSPILHSGAMIRREAYVQVGGYDTSCRYSVDTNMWLALCSVGKIAYIDEPLFAYRAHCANMSNTSGALWVATEEMLHGIDTALARFPDSVLADKAVLRRRAYQRALVAVPTLDIFAGRIKRGWYGFGLACLHYPWMTLAQSRTIALTLRTLLGNRLYRFISLLCRSDRKTKKGLGINGTYA